MNELLVKLQEAVNAYFDAAKIRINTKTSLLSITMPEHRIQKWRL